MKVRNTVGCFALSLLAVAVSQAVYAAEEAAQLGEVTVTGTREATPLAETAAAVGVIKKDDIKLTGPSHPQQILGHVPGVAINVTNGEGHTTGIRQKIGTDAVYLYLEDGIPIRATGFFNHNALYEVNIPSAGGVEVVRGIGSALYGSDAIGGTVNILTSPPADKKSFGLSGESGSDGWYRVLGNANTGMTEKGAMRADLNVSHTDGYRVKTAYDRQSANLRWDYAPGSDSMLKTILGYTKIDQETGANSALTPTEFNNTPTVNARSVAYRKVDALRVSTNYDRDLGQGAMISITPYFRQNNMDLNGSYNFSTSASGDPRIEKTDVNSFGLLAKWRKDYSGPMRARLIAGLDLDYSPGHRTEDALNFAGCTVAGTAVRSQQFNCYAVGPRIYDYDVTFQSVSPYLHSEFSPSDKLRVTAALRHDTMSYDMNNNLSGNIVGTAVAKNYYQVASASKSYSRASPKIGLTYALLPNTHLHAAYSQGFRAPSESQLFRAGLDSTPAKAQTKALGNLGLKPVRAEQYEAGVRGDAGGWNYDLVAYVLKKYDDILSQKDPADPNVTISANNGTTRHRGIELGLGRAIATEWRMDVAYSYAQHTYESWITNTVNYSGKDIESAPHVIGNARLTWVPRAGATAQLEYVKMGSYWLDAANTGKYGGHDLWNLRANYELQKGVSLFGRIINLADKRYADSAAGSGASPTLSPGMPRSYYAGIEAKW